MSKAVMKLALEALELSSVTVDSFGVQGKTREAITALREALAEQPAQQEPVAWRVKWPAIGGGYKWLMVDRPLMEKEGFVNEALFTSPPAQRTWVGLTPEEVQAAVYDENGCVVAYEDYAIAIEAKLKEKNND